MGVITISRGSYSKGKEIAEKLAHNLGYECISRDILLETSTHFNIPEVKLVRAIHDAPSVLERLGQTKEKYITFIREAFLKRIQNDNVVYHGLAGHFFVNEVPHILKVRIAANLEDRVREEMKRENISHQEAYRLLVKDDLERRNWSLNLYGINTRDPGLYDVILHINKLKVDDAVDILTDIARRPCFQTTPESQKMLKDRYLAARARSALFGRVPAVEVKCKDAVVYVNIETDLSLEKEFDDKIKGILKDIDEIEDVRVTVAPFGF